jgi:hypothetical protein
MPGRAALRRRLLGGLGTAVVLAVAGCGEAGRPFVPLKQAAELGVGTTRITVACGTADELRAFGGAHPKGLAAEESIAVSGVRKLAAVYRQDRTRTYQGESVGAVLHDSISLLGDCRLDRARALLVGVLKHG